MRIVIDVPDDMIPTKQEIIDTYIHFIGGTVCEVGGYGFMVLPKGHGDLVDADKVILSLVYGKHIDNAKCGEITKIFDNAVVIPADKGE